MATLRYLAIAFAYAGIVRAQSSSAVNVFLGYDVDQQPLVGTLIHEDASQTTVAFGCPTGVDSDECGFGSGNGDGNTVTFGSSTVILTMEISPLAITINCALTGTTAAACTGTYVGPADVLALPTDDGSDDSSATDTNTQITTSMTTTSLTVSDITYMPITLATLANAASTTTAGTGSTASISTITSSSASGSQATASHTGSANTTSSRGNGTTSHNGAISMGGECPLKWMAGLAGLMGLIVLLL